jgi:hypothetical protein
LPLDDRGSRSRRRTIRRSDSAPRLWGAVAHLRPVRARRGGRVRLKRMPVGASSARLPVSLRRAVAVRPARPPTVHPPLLRQPQLGEQPPVPPPAGSVTEAAVTAPVGALVQARAAAEATVRTRLQLYQPLPRLQVEEGM